MTPDLLRGHLVLLMAMAMNAVHAGEPPYGSPDFYPSPERPVGFRADGSGAWPGAKPVTSWDSKTGKNIAWKAPMPAPSFSTPVVAGHRVFVVSDPNWLTCVDANDGKVLWSTQVDHTTAMPSELAKQVKEDNEFFLKLNDIYYDFRKQVDELEKSVKAAGGDPTSVVRGFGSHRMLVVDPDNPPTGCTITADATLKAKQAELFKIQKENAFRVKRSDNSSMMDIQPQKKSASEVQQRWGRLMQKADIWWFNHWTFLCSESMSSPCTDGERVYTVTAHDTVAAYDMAGKQVWMTWDHPADKVNRMDWLSCRFVGSLVLRHGVLICHVNGEMKAFDAKTGKKLWGDIAPELPDGDKGKKEHNSWGIVNTPGFLDVPLPDGSVLKVAHMHNKLYRLEDGKILGSIALGKGEDPPPHGATYTGNVMLLDMKAYRITATDRESVKPELLWTFTGPRGSSRETASAVIADGKVLARFSVDLATGKTLSIPNCGDKWGCPQLAGNVLFSGLLASEKASWVDISTGKGGVCGGNIDDDRFKTDAEFDRRWRYHYMNGHPFGSSNPTFAGNRIFYRTNGYLWCLGDPKLPYDVKRNR